MDEIVQICKNAKNAAKITKTLTTNTKNEILSECACALRKNIGFILAENAKDVQNAIQAGIAGAFIDRLTLNEKRVEAMAQGLLEVAALPDPTSKTLYFKDLPNGLKVGKKRVPIGVIGIIFESRPNVTADAFGLCLKAGNAVILRGGKEAVLSCAAIIEIFRKILIEKSMNPDFVQVITDASRETAAKLMKMNEYIDVLIPRGGAGLIKATIENSTIPVIETGTGNCHMFVDESADLKKAVEIIINAKTSRPGVCNSLEKLLVHKNIAEQFLPAIYDALSKKGVEIRGDKSTVKIVNTIIPSEAEDWFTEYLDLIICIGVVESVDSAIEHIEKYSTGHSECILSESYTNIQKFLNNVDSAAVYANASTRFTDGGEFGLGAEIGISTQKLHARGPLGLTELTTTKFIIYGNGQTRD